MANLITQLFILNFAKSDNGLCIILTLEKKSLNLVNNAPDIGVWLAKTFAQISAHWYAWQTSLISMHCSQKTFHFFECFERSHINIIRYFDNATEMTQNNFCGVFLKNHKYLREMFLRLSEMLRNRHLFEICSRRLKDVHKKHLFGDVSERSLKCLS